MTEEQYKKSERIASTVMRSLAILGLVAVLALAAWLVVQGLRALPTTGGDPTSSGLGSVFSLFSNTPENYVTWTLDTQVLTASTQSNLRWEESGDAETETSFSYSCNRDVLLRVQTRSGTQDLPCEEMLVVSENSLTVVPISPNARFADITLRLTRADATDAVLVTIENPRASSEDNSGNGVDTTDEDTAMEQDDESDTTVSDEGDSPVNDVTHTTTPPQQPTTSTPETPTHQTPTPVRVTRTPADLMVAIKETGTYLEVQGINTLFPITPIPSDKPAGVTFTVQNRGELPSGAWAFIAHVPTEHDTTYRYTSPVQPSLAGNGVVEFTLGFDELPERGTGSIKIELVPTGGDAQTANNIDAVTVQFR